MVRLLGLTGPHRSVHDEHASPRKPVAHPRDRLALLAEALQSRQSGASPSVERRVRCSAKAPCTQGRLPLVQTRHVPVQRHDADVGIHDVRHQEAEEGRRRWARAIGADGWEAVAMVSSWGIGWSMVHPIVLLKRPLPDET